MTSSEPDQRTPRTDTLNARQCSRSGVVDYAYLRNEMMIHARMLERELSAATARIAEMEKALREATSAINTPEIQNFLRGVALEAVHQVDRWGTAHDRAKRDADWFWLVGYLAGKALHSGASGDRDKALHHCISTAAALYNWHCSIKGVDVRMCPGKSDLEAVLEDSFGTLAAPSPDVSER